MPVVIGRDQGAIRTATCRNCASILEYHWSETFRHKYAYDYLGDYEVGDAIRCPTCNQAVLVKR